MEPSFLHRLELVSLFLLNIGIVVVNDRWRGGIEKVVLRMQTAMLFVGFAFFLLSGETYPASVACQACLLAAAACTAIALLIGAEGFLTLLFRPEPRGFTKPLLPGLRREKKYNDKATV